MLDLETQEPARWFSEPGGYLAAVSLIIAGLWRIVIPRVGDCGGDSGIWWLLTVSLLGVGGLVLACQELKLPAERAKDAEAPWEGSNSGWGALLARHEPRAGRLELKGRRTLKRPGRATTLGGVLSWPGMSLGLACLELMCFQKLIR